MEKHQWDIYFFTSDVMKKYLSATILLLTACANSFDSKQDYSKWSWFSYESDVKYQINRERNDGSLVLATYDENWIGKSFNDYALYFYSDVESNCTSSITGSSTLESFPGKNNAFWGEVEQRNANDRYIDALCYPNTSACSHKDAFEGTCKEATTTYAFCSEHNGKTVVICLDQQTDNPTLAKDIFSSFRWVGAEEETEQLLKEVGLSQE